MSGRRPTLRETPSQTAGPFLHIGCMPGFAGLGAVFDAPLPDSPVSQGARGTPVTITGHVLDGTGWALRDAMLESWQADADGLYPGQPGADPCVGGFARFACDGETGLFTLRTILPGRAGGQAPHIALWIVARGINTGLQTRIYFADADNTGDPVLSRIEQAPRRETLLAVPGGDGCYRFDIRLQGVRETVFLDM